jgi:hypothetical protein
LKKGFSVFKANFASTLKDAQVRINHGEKVEAIKGLVIGVGIN